jgi:hypothetical protein
MQARSFNAPLIRRFLAIGDWLSHAPTPCLVRRLPDQARFSLVLYHGDHSISAMESLSLGFSGPLK